MWNIFILNFYYFVDGVKNKDREIDLCIVNFCVLVDPNHNMNGRNLLDDHLMALETHVRRTYPLQPQRFEQLKSLLANLRTVSSPEIQNVFFKNILGYCSIELILRNLYETITVSL
jgi:hypothetical protein